MTMHHTEGRCHHNEGESTAATVLLVAAAENHDPHALTHALCLLAKFACPRLAVPLVAAHVAAKVLEAGDPVRAGALTFLQDEGVWTFTTNPEHLELEQEAVREAGLRMSSDQGALWTLAGRTVLAAINEDGETMAALWGADDLPMAPALVLLAGVGSMIDSEVA